MTNEPTDRVAYLRGASPESIELAIAAFVFPRWQQSISMTALGHRGSRQW